jgi:Ca2+-binding RTX toxin-like protein
MRAQTRKKHEMGKRFAVVIGVAAVGVMALGAQTATSTPPGQSPPTCDGKPATIVGTNDPPTQGPDVIVLLGKDDFINGQRGNDVICGGPGNDYLLGGKGKDIVLGQKGKDTFDAGEGGKDLCNGGGGYDVVRNRTMHSRVDSCEVEKSIEAHIDPA